MFSKPANRWQAFGVHLLISFFLFLLLAAVIYFLWYPSFLFHYDGGLEGMKLIAAVDFFIGPILTLLVYKVGKKTLRFDLACIAVLQLFCLAGGMWAVWQTRPVAVVYAAGTFSVTNERGYRANGYEIGNIDLFKQRWPMWLGVNLPEDTAAGIGAVWALMGSSLHYNIENYVPYSEVRADLSRSGLKAEDIPDAAAELRELEAVGGETLRFFPITTSMFNGYLAIDTATGAELGFVRKD